AEDGIRDFHVTGVQTCALPILAIILSGSGIAGLILPPLVTAAVAAWSWRAGFIIMAVLPLLITLPLALQWLSSSERVPAAASKRSEEHTSELQSRENLVCRLLL